MAEQPSSSKLLIKYYKIKDTKQLVDKLNSLPEEKFGVLEIKEDKYNRLVKWNNKKTNLKDLFKIISPAENKKFIVSLFQSMLKTIDSDSDALSEARKMKSPGSFSVGDSVDSAYSALLGNDRKRRESLRHLLDQLKL